MLFRYFLIDCCMLPYMRRSLTDKCKNKMHLQIFAYRYMHRLMNKDTYILHILKYPNPYTNIQTHTHTCTYNFMHTAHVYLNMSILKYLEEVQMHGKTKQLRSP